MPKAIQKLCSLLVAAVVLAAWALFLWVVFASATFGQTTRNFTAEAANPSLARSVAEAAERARLELAQSWLGRTLPDWPAPCTIRAKIDGGNGGATSFTFDGGRAFGFEMNIQGTPERLIDSVVPHEVLHTVFATHFGRPLPRWADEGACTTVEHRSEVVKQERLLVHYLKTNKGIPFKDLFAMSEYPPEVMTLYAQGHSLASFLIEQRGRRAFVGFLETGLASRDWSAALKKHYGHADPDRLGADWLTWVKAGRPQLTYRGPMLGSSGAVATAAARPVTRVVRRPILGSGVRLYVFSTPGCGPCQQMAPTVGRLISEGLPIERVDGSRRPDLTGRYGVDSYPTTIAVDAAGQEVARAGGFLEERRIRSLLSAGPGVRVAVGDAVNVSVGNGSVVGPSLTERLLPALVRVSVPTDGGSFHGSGAVVLNPYNDEPVIVTAWHVARDAPQMQGVTVGKPVTVYCPFFGRRTLQAEIATQNGARTRADDLAVITLRDGPARRLLRGVARRIGRRVRGALVGLGLGGPAQPMRFFRGSLEKRVAYSPTGPDQALVIAAAEQPRQGDSGGPVFDRSGDLIGVINAGWSAGEPGRFYAAGPEMIDNALRYAAGYAPGQPVPRGGPSWRDPLGPADEQYRPYQQPMTAGGGQQQLLAENQRLRAALASCQCGVAPGGGSLIDKGRAIAREGGKEAIKLTLTQLITGGGLLTGGGILGGGVAWLTRRRNAATPPQPVAAQPAATGPPPDQPMAPAYQQGGGHGGLGR